MCLKSEFPNVSLFVDDSFGFFLAWSGLCEGWVCLVCLVWSAVTLTGRFVRSIILMSVVS